MVKVSKFVLQTTTHTLELPEQSRPLHVGEDGGQLCMWVLLDTEQRPEVRTVRVLSSETSGQEVVHRSIGRDLRFPHYVGTAQMALGAVWHVFVD